MSGHDRRPKEAAQLGAYHVMLTGSNGGSYYMDQRGRRQTIDCELRMGIVTFCPDGTWAMHEVDTDEATAAYELALSMRHQSKVSTLYKGRAVVSEPFDPNPRLVLSIGNVPDDAPEKMALAKAWQEAGLGKPSNGEVEPGRYGEAMHLIYSHTRRFQPFVASGEDTERYAPEHEVAALAERMKALPSDLRDEAERNAAGLRSLSSMSLTEADAEDWDRVLQIAETAHRKRQQQAVAIFKMAKEQGVLVLLPSDLAAWTDRQLTYATAIVSAAHTGDIRATTDGINPSTKSTQRQLDLHGDKNAVKKLAREKASEYGLDAPSKWDDLVSDPVLWSLLVAT